MSSKHTLNSRLRGFTKLPDTPRECYVCEGKKGVQNHHVVKVASIVNMIMNAPYQVNLAYVYMPCVYLCHSHHKKLHGLMDDYQTVSEDYRYTINEREYTKYNEILDSVEIDRVFNTPYEMEYKKEVDTLKNTVSFNLNEHFEKEMSEVG